METGKIIEVTTPSFLINKKDPSIIKTFNDRETINDNDWKFIEVVSYGSRELPTPRKDEILYKYILNRGYLYQPKLELEKTKLEEIQAKLNKYKNEL